MNPENLLKLSGMKYKPAEFTPEEWEQKTGVNPSDFPGLIHITKSGRCCWSQKAENFYQAFSRSTKRDWATLGINC